MWSGKPKGWLKSRGEVAEQMSLQKYERRMTGLRCNCCDHQFEDFAWHEAIQTSDQGVIG